MSKPIHLSDSELDAVFAAARPLSVDVRDPFLRAVAHELQGCSVIGPGVVHQVCREQQRIFMNGAWPDSVAGARSEQVALKFPALACELMGRVWRHDEMILVSLHPSGIPFDA